MKGLKMGRKNKGWASWTHHCRLVEYCTDYNGRKKFIKENKVKSEISKRLSAFQWWIGRLPLKLVKAMVARDKALVAFDKTYKKAAAKAYDKAMEAYDKAYKEGYPTLVKQFKKVHPEIEFDEKQEKLKF